MRIKPVVLCVCAAASAALEAAMPPEWSAMLVKVRSTLDGTEQPCYFWSPEKAKSENKKGEKSKDAKAGTKNSATKNGKTEKVGTKTSATKNGKTGKAAK